MKNKYRYLSVLTAGLAFAMTSVSQVAAQSVPAKLNAVSPAITLKGMFDGANTVKINSGVMQFDVFDAFCVDPLQSITVNQVVNYDVSLTFSTPTEDKAIAKLVGGYYASGQSANEAAATQWAIWEVLIDGLNNPSLTSGNARVFNSTIAQLGEQYLANIDQLPEANVRFLTNARYQDVVTVVPEPSSTALLGLGVIGFLVRRKRS